MISAKRSSHMRLVLIYFILLLITHQSFAIIGGRNAEKNEFPFLINIFSRSADYTDHLCGGSLIAEKWVLTAAHCLLEDVTDKALGTVKLNEVELFIGSLDIHGKNGRKLTAKKILIHPSFQWPNFDIALIQLDESVTDVIPVKINSIPFNNFTAENGVTAGWGLTSDKSEKQSEFLQAIQVPLISKTECQNDAWVQQHHWRIESDMICAKTFKGAKATCSGDSGSPLFQNNNGDWLQIGIVSWGSACRVLNKNNQSDVEGYHDVSASAEWIHSQISN